MSNEIVQHRFVQIHQACDLTSNTEEPWSTLSQSSLPNIAASNACERILDKVNNNQLEATTALREFQTLVLSSDDEPKSMIYLRCVTLLRLQTKAQFGLVKNDLVHIDPFVAIVRQRPMLYYAILNEIEYLFREKETTDIAILTPFTLMVLLTDNNLDYNALLGKLTSICFSVDNKEIVKSIHALIWKQVIMKYPLHMSNPRYLTIVDFLEIISTQFQQQVNFDAMDWMLNYCYPILDRALTCASKGEPILPYLSRIERLYSRVHDDRTISTTLQASISLLWAGCSFLLLKSQTLDEQQSILSFIQFCITHGSIPKRVMQIAYLPLFQTLSELMDKSASKSIQERKNQVLDLIYTVDKAKDIEVDVEDVQTEISNIIRHNTIHGLLGHLFTYILSFCSNEMPKVDILSKNLSSTSVTLSLLFLTPFTLDDDTQVQCKALSALSELSFLQTGCYKFPVLLYLLHVIRRSSGKSDTLLHIFHHVLPSLSSTNDPIITSKVLQIILSIIHTEDNDLSMASLGVRALVQVYERQPRVWQELKKVFTDWVLRRKSVTLRRKVDLSVTGPIRLELSVLTSMRDVCQLHPRECAPDILPMVISLLQACQDLSMASLSIIMSIICTCVEAGFVEPRSIWSITVVYLARFALDAGTKRSLLLIKQLCRFYALAGDKDEVTEPYLQFKETLLNDFILPLISSDNDCQESKTYALKALSHFSANDIATLIPEKAKDYLSMILESEVPSKGYSPILVKLMSNELDHMRRGLFIEETSKKPETISKKRKASTTGEREEEVGKTLTEKWMEGHVAPGLRAGYATAILHILNFSREPISEHTFDAISKTKWYRAMVTSFTDLTLTDHLLVRVSSISSWQAFFQAALKGKEVEIESIVSILLKDLLARLERSTVPGVSTNILLAITGLVSTLRAIIPSFASSCANDIVQVLLRNYILLQGSPLSHSAHLMSEEVQFAARFALGHLSTHVISNDKLAETISKTLIEAATYEKSKSRNIDTAVDLVQFANGYAAGYFVSSVIQWPTKTEQLDVLGKQGLYQLLGYCNSPGISESRVLGIMMGLSSKQNANGMEEVLWLAKDVLRSYTDGRPVNIGLLLGSTWVCGVGSAPDSGAIDDECASILESAYTRAVTDGQLAQHFYHFSVPYSQLCRSRLVNGSKEENEAMHSYKRLLDQELERIDNDDPSSNYRIAGLFSLGSLLGVHYLPSEDSSDRLYIESSKYSASTRHTVWDKLVYAAGLTGRSSAPVGNLKSGRIAAAVCGKIINHAQLMAATSQIKEKQVASDLLLLSASSEPASYSRLNQNTSYIRAVFDSLVSLVETERPLTDHLELLLSSLLLTPGPLPPVNWFMLMNEVSSVSSSLRDLCIRFASAHASSSLSLTEFLLSQLSIALDPLKKHTLNAELCLLLTTEPGLGKVLELAGLPSSEKAQTATRRGLSSMMKKASISDSRALEIVQNFAKQIHMFEKETQLQFFVTLSNHLPIQGPDLDETKMKLVTDIRKTILHQLTLPWTRQAEPEMTTLLRHCVACSLDSPDQLQSKESFFEQTDQEGFGAIVAICELYRLTPKTKRHPLVKWIAMSMAYLVGLRNSPLRYASWEIIAATIEQDVTNEQEMLAWVVRVLDAFIVYGNGHHQTCAIDILAGIADGLRCILGCLFGQVMCPAVTDDGIKMADTIYSMMHTIEIGNKHASEQEQIALRLFTLMDMMKEQSWSYALPKMGC
ncbi:hypothetical protein RMATCC62417_03647 [Rhizopus microsporus]|nr:hypothetical protein RMATCC62417_03647 [Rhizopus microsporus]